MSSYLLIILFVIQFLNLFLIVQSNESCDAKSDSRSNPTRREATWTNTEAFANLKKTSVLIKENCGQICNTKIKGRKGKYYDVIWKDFDCPALFSTDVFDKKSEFFRSPKSIPKFLVDDFTYDGRIPIATELSYVDESRAPVHIKKWTMKMVDDYRMAARDGSFYGYLYGKESSAEVYWYLLNEMNIKGKHVLVVGTQAPWLESLILEAGANMTTSLDYVKLESEHPQMKIMTVEEFREHYNKGSLPSFDAIVTFSSLEHSGLGRYGDGLNPWGDLITMARLWCIVKPGTKLLIGVPTGYDLLMFNCNRIYGPLFYSHLFANWHQISTRADITYKKPFCTYCYQPVHIIEKPKSKEDFFNRLG